MRILKLCLTVYTFVLFGWGGTSHAQTGETSAYEDAMVLHQIRKDYPRFCKSLGLTQAGALVPASSSDYQSLHPHLRSCIDNIARFAATGSSMPSGSSFNRGFNTPSPGSVGSTAIDTSTMSRLRAGIISDWHYAEAFVLGKDQTVQPDGILNTSNTDLTANFPSSFNYLREIGGQVSGNSAVVATQTSGLLSGLTGGLPEAQIIQGIVDWTIQRAKAELLQAFLQGWLDDLEKDSVLQIAFPATLALLSTTDLTTIFSQGDTWKAAFQQDLDALPVNMPKIVAAIIRRLPRQPKPAVTREIVGGVNVASQLYLQLDRNHHNLQDAVSLISRSIMLRTDTLAYSERAMVCAEILLNSVQTVRNNLPEVVSPRAILNLGATQLTDLWNVIYLRNKARLLRALELQQPDTLYSRIARELSHVQLILARTADIVQNINDILDVGTDPNSNAGSITSNQRTAPVLPTITFQEANSYYNLVLDLLNNSMDLAGLLNEPTEDIREVINNVVDPIGSNLMTIAYGVSTQQYGEVVTSGIQLLRTLSNQLVRDPRLRANLNAANALLISVTDLRASLKDFQGSGTDLKLKASKLLSDWLKTNPRDADDEVALLVRGSLVSINGFADTDLSAVQAFLKGELKDLQNGLTKYLESLDLGQGIDQLADFFNRYGTLMVNILTASSSEEVKEALDEAAAPRGSYMVKQTSTSSITVTFFPGLALGHEYSSADRNLVASGGDTLTHGNGNYLGATLPVGLEMAFGIRSKVIGAVGIYGQLADLGAVLNYRLHQPGDSVQITSEVNFKRVLSPGLGFVVHAARIPIVLGGRLSYSPQLRTVSDGTATYGLNAMQVGGFVAVDVTVFQIFASRRKIPRPNPVYHSRKK